MPLPRILAGPALRRTESQAVWIWLCTSESLEPSAQVYLVNDAGGLGERVGESSSSASRSFRLSDTLHVHLIKVVPVEERFDHTTVLAYRLFESVAGESQPLREYDEQSLGLGAYLFPTFVIQNPRSNALRVLFASCRKLHGDGEDASVGMLAHCVRSLTSNLGRRPTLQPTALFLTGDQIYADDVANMIFPTVTRMAGELRPEFLPEVGLIAEPAIAERQFGMSSLAGFTSLEASNHLNTLGEYAAMYLLAWNDLTWNLDDLGPAPATLDVTDSEAVARNDERNSLLRGLHGSFAMRRLLANVPTYMMFDDHDVTDDWNINPSWERHVRSKPLGRRIITNALVAYWAFQGWGNDPEAFDDEFLERVRAYLVSTSGTIESSSDEQALQEDMYVYLNANREEHLWSFVAPTVPGAVFIDFRTQRSASRDTALADGFLDLREPVVYSVLAGLAAISDEFSDLALVSSVTRMRETRLAAELGRTRLNGIAPRLINSRLRRRARQLVASFSRKPMILVTGTPVIGASIVDFGQEVAVFAQGSFTWDFENWRGDPENLLDLYALLHYSEASACAVLSGDVHYASAFLGEVEWAGGTSPRRMNLGQFTSSAAKHQKFPHGEFMRLVQEMLGTGRDLASRWLGAAPSGSDGSATAVGRMLFASTAEMRAFAPVFSLSAVPDSALLPDTIYCDESWRMQALSGTGIYSLSNFGWLVASNETAQLMSVQILDAAGSVLGDTMRLAATLD